MNECRSVLITGATGFIGSHLVNKLVQSNQQVHIIVRPASNLQILESVKERLTVHVHDGSMAGMSAILQESHPDCVIHLATLFLSNHKAEDISPLITSNILFGTQLLEAMDAAGIKKLINASSAWQHYQDAAYDPISLYAATKQAFEDILVYYTSARSFNAITLELNDTYGPNDPRKKLFYLLRNAQETREVLKMTPGEQLLDLVYIDDVMDAFLNAEVKVLSTDSPQNRKYQVTSGKYYSIREIVKIYQEVSHQEINVEFGGRPYREREIMVPWSRGEKLPGWEPKIGIIEGISRMIGA